MTDFTLPSKFDRMIHQQVRLAIVAVLAGCESADFTYLLNATEINKGTLSKNLSALEEVAYLEITKGYKGRRAFAQYRRQHRRFIDSVD
jgi:DNA-binding HxlR family transcriptional regulator